MFFAERQQVVRFFRYYSIMIQSCCPTNEPANARKNLPFSETCLPKARLLSDPLTDKIDKSGGFCYERLCRRESAA